MFFHFSQNNSGGKFHYDKKAGISHHVVIEAENAEFADAIAGRIGIYFNGCDKGMDCGCCGDRWHPASTEGDKVPKVYGQDVRKKGPSEFAGKWIDGPEVFVHYKDGTIKGYWK